MTNTKTATPADMTDTGWKGDVKLFEISDTRFTENDELTAFAYGMPLTSDYDHVVVSTADGIMGPSTLVFPSDRHGKCVGDPIHQINQIVRHEDALAELGYEVVA